MIIPSICLFIALVLLSAQPMQAQSILFTEILPDPTPSIGLPEQEFLELCNPSPDPINLRGWTLLVGERSTFLPPITIPSQTYVILCSESGIDDFVSYRDEHGSSFEVVALDKWLSLSNAGQYVVLLDETGTIVHFVEYSPAQYPDLLKRDGGWSLELRCFDHPCDPQAWLPSEHASGGTPGMGSVPLCHDQFKTDFKALRIGYLDEYSFSIFFDGFIQADNIKEIKLDLRDEHALPLMIKNLEFLDHRSNQLQVILTSPLVLGAKYRLSISGSTASCSGNVLRDTIISFGMPEEPTYEDLIISEIMFEPTPDQIEFIEVFNPSSTCLELNTVIIQTIDEEGLTKDYSNMGAGSFLVLPAQYVMICKDYWWARKAFPMLDPSNIHIRQDLPALVNNGGRIRILNSAQQIIDEACYDPDWHYPGLETEQGVSLERVDLQVSGCLSSNWFSSAASNSYSTPGRRNSQSLEISENEADKASPTFLLESDLVTPDQDGVGDQLMVRYTFPEHGWKALVEIRNIRGGLIARPLDWQLLGLEGLVCWDGFNLQGELASTGIYVVLFSYRHPDGTARRWKSAFSLRYY